jgi:glycosyltransferase involved in cell wall biosynthesis
MIKRNVASHIDSGASGRGITKKEELTVAYLSTHDARDINSFRGVPHHLTASLEKAGMQVERFEPLRNRYDWLTQWKRRFYDKIFDQTYTWFHEPFILKDLARQIDERLANSRADVVLVQEPQLLPYRDWQRPVVIYTDCFFRRMIDYYHDDNNLCRESLRKGEAVEQAALDTADLVIGTSEWAADTAVSDYGVPASNVRVVPWGASLESERTEEDVQELVDRRPREVCRLLFVGVVWERKGGNRAVEVARLLNERGLPTELTVIGCQPDTARPLPDFTRVLGFVDKGTPEGAARFARAFGESHFFILPSQAETFGIVFCEASSFGVPSLAPNTGGVPTIIRDGRNGKVFDYDSEAMADYVQALFEDREAYESLARSSFREYQKRLNWTVTGKLLKKLFDQLNDQS